MCCTRWDVRGAALPDLAGGAEWEGIADEAEEMDGAAIDDEGPDDNAA